MEHQPNILMDVPVKNPSKLQHAQPKLLNMDHLKQLLMARALHESLNELSHSIKLIENHTNS